jgi:hypothetical protein
MAIIKNTKGSDIKYEYLNIFPDQFVSEKEKQKPSYIKSTMDYFRTKAYAEYAKNRDTFVKNYDLIKGILRTEDFYEDPEVKSFTEILEADLELPKYVKHYSIITTPINELIGEMSKRPDTFRVKAFDADSQNEELQFRTDALHQFILSGAKKKILEKAAMEGVQIDDEELQEMTFESVKDQLDSYTSVPEKWGNRVLTATKAEFNLKEKSEEAFRDLCIGAREFYLIDEDNSKLGYNVEELNPKNVWVITTPDKKYTSDPSGRAKGAYAAGTVHVMELSELIEAFPELTKEEIDHIRTSQEDFGLINARESNLGRNVKPGPDSIIYDTYDPLVMQERMLIEGEMKDNKEDISDFLGISSNVSAFGYKYVVVRAYFISKKKIGRLTFLDEMENEQTMLVDENYKSGTMPTEIDLEWGWINQWYRGLSVGHDVYHLAPFKLLDYCPIIGTTYESKNTEARSVVDMMKPFQIIYNVCMNQLFSILKKEIGNVANVNIRRIPRIKDGDDQDALDMWEMEARERGITFDDDSPENTKAPVSNTSVAKNIDLTRTQEIQSRYTLAVQMKNECWELVGMSKQRLGNVSATETATGTNAALQQSYTQTEPLFVAHEYVMRQLYQAILDASVFVESQKPVSTLSYITSEGESAFMQINGVDLKFRDLKVFPTNRPEDTQMFNELRQLAQAVLQNNGSIYDIVELYSTKSMREMKKTFKQLRDRTQAMQEDAQRLEQEKIDQAREAVAAQIEEARVQKEEEMANDNYNKELDRINDKEIAIIRATGFGQVGSEDLNQNNVPDAFEVSKLVGEESKANRDYQVKMAEINSKNEQMNKKLQIEREKLEVDKANQKNDLQIAKVNARNRAKKKT